MKHRKILIGCIAASLFIHVTALGFFQRYSLWFSSLQKTAISVPFMEKKERDQILKAAFEREEKEVGAAIPQPQQETRPPLALQSPAHPPEPEFPPYALFQTPFFINDLLATNPIFPTFSIPSSPFDLLSHLPKDLMIPTPEQRASSLFPPIHAEAPVSLAAKMPRIQQEAPTPLVEYSEAVDLTLTEEPRVAKAPNPIQLPNLPKLPTLDELETSSFSDSFEADLVFVERDGGGYVFALTLIPRPDLELPKINQNFTFLIDRANSIQQDRLNATKTAVKKALEELGPEDTFNIIAFDSKMEKLAPQPLLCTKQSVAQAEEFLGKIQLGSFFSSSDLFKPLFLTVPGRVQQEELHTVILLTDGESLAKKNGQRSLLHDWTQINGGKVVLYTLGLNSDAHYAMLDAAAVFNKGKFISCPTNRGIKRKLLKLMKTIQAPIAKNMACKAISRSPTAKIQFFPTTIPNLYLDQPFVILGETETLDDFILFVQGRLKDRWLNIKKNVSFVNGRKGNKSLKQEWAMQKTFDLYRLYLLDEDPKHIAEVQRLLEPFDMQVPFR